MFIILVGSPTTVLNVKTMKLLIWQTIKYWCIQFESYPLVNRMNKIFFIKIFPWGHNQPYDVFGQRLKLFYFTFLNDISLIDQSFSTNMNRTWHCEIMFTVPLIQVYLVGVVVLLKLLYFVGVVYSPFNTIIFCRSSVQSL